MRSSILAAAACMAGLAAARSLSTVAQDAVYDSRGLNNSQILSARANSQMSDIFTVDDTCDSRDPDGILEEAQEMVSGAIKALDDLINNSVNPGLSSKDTQRQVEAAVIAFGISKPTLLTWRLSNADKAILGSAKSVFSTLSDTLNNGKGISKASAFLYCDSTNFKWAEKKATDVFLPPLLSPSSTDTIEQFFQNQQPPAQVKGLWYDPHKKVTGMQVWTRDEYNGAPICAPNHAEGITFRGGFQKIFICPKAWRYYKASIKADKAKTGVVKWDAYRSVPGVFVHEMLHRQDPNINDKPCKTPGGGTTPSYGLDKVYGLANVAPNNKADALHNADSFNVFATMMYLPHADWE